MFIGITLPYFRKPINLLSSEFAVFFQVQDRVSSKTGSGSFLNSV
jgi:hypothetical protein